MVRLIGWILIVLYGFVMITTFPLRNSPVMFPWLIPIFGVPFAIMYLVAQYGLVFYLHSLRGKLLVTGFFSLGMLITGYRLRMGSLGAYYATHHISNVRALLVVSVCLSGFALGAALLRQWVDWEQ